MSLNLKKISDGFKPDGIDFDAIIKEGKPQKQDIVNGVLKQGVDNTNDNIDNNNSNSIEDNDTNNNVSASDNNGASDIVMETHREKVVSAEEVVSDIVVDIKNLTTKDNVRLDTFVSATYKKKIRALPVLSEIRRQKDAFDVYFAVTFDDIESLSEDLKPYAKEYKKYVRENDPLVIIKDKLERLEDKVNRQSRIIEKLEILNSYSLLEKIGIIDRPLRLDDIDFNDKRIDKLLDSLSENRKERKYQEGRIIK